MTLDEMAEKVKICCYSRRTVARMGWRRDALQQQSCWVTDGHRETELVRNCLAVAVEVEIMGLTPTSVVHENEMTNDGDEHYLPDHHLRRPIQSVA